MSLPGIYGFYTSRSRDILGIKYKTFHESLVDTLGSLQEVNHQGIDLNVLNTNMGIESHRGQSRSI